MPVVVLYIPLSILIVYLVSDPLVCALIPLYITSETTLTSTFNRGTRLLVAELALKRRKVMASASMNHSDCVF